VITRNGVTEFEECYGLANRGDGVPIRPVSRFGVASLTKMFTAVTVVDLVRQGKVGFETPVVGVLPQDRRPATLRADVTVHHLLTHSSGIADYFEEEDEDLHDESFQDLWLDRPCYRMLRPADFLPMFGDLPPYRGPGERFQYSNAGYIVLGLLIEELTGRPYIDAVQEAVFDRAGMASSGFFQLDEARPDIAVGYLPPRRPGGPWRSNIYGIPVVGGADGGAFSNAGDLDRFLHAYGSGELTGPELLATVLTPYWEMDPGLYMGYGVIMRGEGEAHRYGHGGGDPGYEVLIHRFPALGVHTIVLCNVEGVCGAARDLLVDGVLSTITTP
jgi:CubicO group peptidase (beta-lactamase class C family)